MKLLVEQEQWDGDGVYPLWHLALEIIKESILLWVDVEINWEHEPEDYQHAYGDYGPKMRTGGGGSYFTAEVTGHKLEFDWNRKDPTQGIPLAGAVEAAMGWAQRSSIQFTGDPASAVEYLTQYFMQPTSTLKVSWGVQDDELAGSCEGGDIDIVGNVIVQDGVLTRINNIRFDKETIADGVESCNLETPEPDYDGPEPDDYDYDW